MTEAQQRAAAKQFALDWKDRGDEKQETQRFWIELLTKIFGIDGSTAIAFELPVKLEHTSFIDAYIASTRVLIEQKGQDIDLNKGYKQSDGSMLTPYGQARRYAGFLPFNQTPRWIVVCNFREFHIHDMNRPNDEPEIVLLADLEKEFHRLDFLVDTGNENIRKEMEVSLKAGELVGVLYDALLKQYADPTDPNTLKSLNALCVRLVFCLYAEDAGIFGRRSMFHDYLSAHRGEDRRALINLFRVLDQRPEKRDKYLDEDLAAFPYVNGGLFADEDIEIPRLGNEIIDLLLEKASADFDWSAISPTIFGAVFESTLNPETRRSGGMHYTSIENIHKVIDPLFLDGLKAEFEEIKSIKIERTQRAKLQAFQQKLAGLTFLDPACGSGNFLTETYISLRRLENEVISLLHKGQITLDIGNPIQVSIGQFYGIELNDFAVTVAKTALWIAESQMMKETEDVVHMSLDFLPLKSYANITEGNALRMDWPRTDYIMGNPPFVGARMMDATQKDDVNAIFPGWKNAGNLDYVSCWYKKAADLMTGTVTRAALVSTNSVTQGEAVANLWKPLFEAGVHIDFAHRTFRWDSEAKSKAHVHCVIVGFSTAPNDKPKVIYTSDRPQVVENINGYLLDADNIFVESRSKPICDVPEIGIGNKPIDGGFYLFTKEEMGEFLQKEPAAAPYFRPWYGSYEFINRCPRYCLWLGECPPNELRKLPECMKRVEAVRQTRLASKSPGTVKLADKPTRFHVENMPKGSYILLPKVSSERRRYVPMGFMTPDILSSDLVFIIPDATLYHFGILTSNIHMAWMRAVCGRLKSDYRYSKDVVYNNFPWPTPTEEQRAKIETTAQGILDARALYPDASLADLYDETTMPPELRKAHQENDKAVIQAYGFDVKTTTESSCVAELMRMYQELTKVH
ncbi:MAG: SAM-dependent DNA methyltransferase [Oscillospiraceae bacterium]|nr:SAM-dependent DNA methyltransferase [Oscillospiraceae bacterium]